MVGSNGEGTGPETKYGWNQGNSLAACLCKPKPKALTGDEDVSGESLLFPRCCCEENEEAELSELEPEVVREGLAGAELPAKMGEPAQAEREGAVGTKALVVVEVVVVEVVLVFAKVLGSRGFFCRSRCLSLTLYSRVECGTPK